MSIENEQVEDVVEVPEHAPTLDAEGKDTTDWKAIAEMNRDLALKNRGIAQRFKTKLEKSKEVAPPANPVKPNEPASNDLGEKAYLIANGVKGADEIAFVQKMKKETGKDVESLLESTYFQTEFKDFKEKKATDKATPQGNNRSSNPSADSVEYWIAKGELPTGPENKELREKIVNARMKKEESKGQFYNS